MSNVVEFSASNNIPEDILLQVVYKLPVKSLGRFSCVSKLWYNLINNNKQQFIKFHMVESQKKPILIFTSSGSSDTKRFYYLEKEKHGNNHMLLSFEDKYRNQDVFRGDECIAGYDNGLACYSKPFQDTDGEWVYFQLGIRNHSRAERLIIVSRFLRKSKVHGEFDIWKVQFGYDHLNNEYKVMCIVRYKEVYEYYIFTLGSSNPWRKINNPWSKQRPRPQEDFQFKRVPPQISCNGTIFYETIKDKTEKELYKRFALVSFDLHGEKFQIIKHPGDDEFVSNYNRDVFSMMEYKGCFCYSSMEKSDSYNGVVVLYILKDTFKPVWVKETIKFDLPRELDSPAPPSTRIVNFSNQIILYWRLYSKIQLYNVHSKELKEVKHADEALYHHAIHYLSSHAESFLSLETFVTTTNGRNTRDVLRKSMQSNCLIKKLFNVVPTSNPAIISFLYPL